MGDFYEVSYSLTHNLVSGSFFSVHRWDGFWRKILHVTSKRHMTEESLVMLHDLIFRISDLNKPLYLSVSCTNDA